MAAPKKATHVVAHKKLYLAVEGKLQHVPAGTEIALDEKAAKQMGKKVMKLGEQKTVDLTSGEGGGDKPFEKLKVDEMKAVLDEAKIEYLPEHKKDDLIEIYQKANSTGS